MDLAALEEMIEEQRELDEDLKSTIEEIYNEDALDEKSIRKLVTRMYWLREEQRQVSKEK